MTPGPLHGDTVSGPLQGAQGDGGALRRGRGPLRVQHGGPVTADLKFLAYPMDFQVREGAIGETSIKYRVSPAQGHQGGLYNTVSPSVPPADQLSIQWTASPR